MESPEDKFRRIAEYRVKKVLDSLRVLGNCANRRSYTYTEEQVNKIFDAIQKKLEITKAKFASDKKIDFKL